MIEPKVFFNSAINLLSKQRLILYQLMISAAGSRSHRDTTAIFGRRLRFETGTL